MVEVKRYKCFKCFAIVDANPCPICGETHNIKAMCERDRICTCIEDITQGARFCPVCGEPMCPCGSHSVVQISRVTGLKEKLCAFFHGNLSDVSGWNKGKVAEFMDRHRYDDLGGVVE